MQRFFKRFRRDENGIASVEFALLGTVLMLFFAGSFDIVYMVSAKRDADRAAVLLARAMSSCTRMSCIQELVNDYAPRQTNALIRHPNASVQLFLVQSVGGVIKTCFGNLTTITNTDLLSTVKTVLRDGDAGSAVAMTIQYRSMLPNAVLSYISSAGETYSSQAVDTWMNSSRTLCQ